MNANSDAYAAGLVDGEGCVYIALVNKRPQLRMQVTMTSKAASVLKWMRDQFGGRLHQLRRDNDRWDAEVMWKCNGAEASAALKRMLPFRLFFQF